ncbi:MAG: HD domain-containing phosphohydrolase [Vicinamibacterales bacterium]
MAEAIKLPLSARCYLALISVLGAGVLAASAPATVRSPADWLVLAGLALLTGSFTVKVPGVSARLSVSETFVIAAVLLYGVEIATIVVALDVLVMSLRLKASHRSVHRLLFNVATGSIAIWVSGQLFFWLVGTTAVPINLSLERLLLPLACLALSYFLLNSGLIAIALSFQRSVPAYTIWRTNFVGLSLNYIAGASVATLLVSYAPNVNLTALGIIVPLLLITYLTFRTSMGRLEDANRHVNQLNELYLSTIETLAMAVDAKDQITHGHIRRVQVYAAELSKRLGVTDERQLAAIEAAALLHDMGKLAIPEHILNKPGKLTSAEFEKMKRHAEIGADLLSSIPFPYPVVPIVRHHHENWDGTGYPNRIAGTDIPLGARVLSVVDCFDALTSDRPYRPRLSIEAAFHILRERRGMMYDPLVVDTFMAAYENIAPIAIRAGQEARTLLQPVASESPNNIRALDEIHAGSVEGVALLEVRRLLGDSNDYIDALDAIFRVIRRFTPITVLALYDYDSSRDVLRCTHAIGDGNALLTGLEIANGERASGWAAANRCSISNSVAALDLGSVANGFNPHLKSTLCAPITDNGSVLGVLSLYSTLESPFTGRHQYLAEQIATFFVSSMRALPRIQRLVVPFPDGHRRPARG